MASVYATIADEGRYHQPYAIDRITDRQGRVLETFGPHAAQQVLSKDTADKLVDMLRGVVTMGTGSMMRTRFVPEARLADVAGKTGTTQRNTDGWFIAIHPQLVTGAWVGFNDQRVTMRSSYWGQGGHNALTLVGDFMARMVQHKRLDASLVFSSPMTLAVRSVPAGGSDAFDWDKALSSPPPAAGPMDESSGTIEQVPDGGAQPGSAPPMQVLPRRREDDGEAPKSAQELGEAMKAMGRDPETGAPVDTFRPSAALQGASR
jgi:penicillin-binding protein 1A